MDTSISSAKTAHFALLRRSFADVTQRDDNKYQTLKDISEWLQEQTESQFDSAMESLMPIFIKMINTTSPQFISENNTLQLRKLIFEVILKTCASKITKQFALPLQQLIFKIIFLENEENALIMLKILNEYGKTFHTSFPTDLKSFINQWKNLRYELLDRSLNPTNQSLFKTSALPLCREQTVEAAAMEALKSCFSMQPISQQIGPQKMTYTLIPKSSVSVKVLYESTIFIMHINKNYQNLIDYRELATFFMRLASISTQTISDDPAYNKEVADEFHAFQVRGLGFLASYSSLWDKQGAISEPGKYNAIATFICTVQDNMLMHNDYHHRRELLGALKCFFQSNVGYEFMFILPKICQEKYLIGTSYTSKDQLRNLANSYLADILHYVRMHMDFNMICQALYLAFKIIQDGFLIPAVQTLYCKLIMNLIEPLLIYLKQSNDLDTRRLCVDILIKAIELYAGKLQVIQRRIKQLLDSSPARTDDSHRENSKLNPLRCMDTNFWHESSNMPSLQDCKNAMRFMLLPVKVITLALKEIDLKHEALSFYPLLDSYTKIFLYGIKCLNDTIETDVYRKFSNVPNLQKEDKEVIESFVAIFASIDAAHFEALLRANIEVKS